MWVLIREGDGAYGYYDTSGPRLAHAVSVDRVYVGRGEEELTPSNTFKKLRYWVALL